MSALPDDVILGARAERGAPAASYALPVPRDARARLARGWLWLGLAALLGSGLFALLLVLARAPYTQALFPWMDFFRTALVVHVDLSVLVWFVAFGGVLWSLNSTARWLALGRAALGLGAAGAALVAIAPFLGDGHPLMSNYIPVLRQPAFLLGLVLFALGTLLVVLRAMVAIPPVGPYIDGAAALRFGLNAAAVATLLALGAFGWSFMALPASMEATAYYELLFWGGGHVLQFTYTLLLLVAWVWLADASGLALAASPRVMLVLFGLGLGVVFFVPLVYYTHPVGSAEHVILFTWLMRYGGSLATLPLALLMVLALVRGTPARGSAKALRAALLASILLFGAGGGIGFLIRGSDVTIPAHYHGAIVGVTLAFMGLTYHLLPRLGYGAVDARWAARQPWLYGGGQFLHVFGLLISGGYGVARKVAGAEQGLDGLGRIVGMGLMGLGGLIAIAGGAVFVAVVLRALAGGPGFNRADARAPRSSIARAAGSGRKTQESGT